MTSMSARVLDAEMDSLFVLAGLSAGLLLKANVKMWDVAEILLHVPENCLERDLINLMQIKAV